MYVCMHVCVMQACTQIWDLEEEGAKRGDQEGGPVQSSAAPEVLLQNPRLHLTGNRVHLQPGQKYRSDPARPGPARRRQLGGSNTSGQIGGDLQPCQRKDARVVTWLSNGGQYVVKWRSNGGQTWSWRMPMARPPSLLRSTTMASTTFDRRPPPPSAPP